LAEMLEQRTIGRVLRCNREDCQIASLGGHAGRGEARKFNETFGGSRERLSGLKVSRDLWRQSPSGDT
jgi:hypothetical protein